MLVIHTNPGRNITEGSKDQADTGTMSHDKAASSTMEKQSDQFSYKDETLQINHLVNTALLM